ncbi:putative bifunctional diguanylate cyclase/phosphodiesterase [Flavisphingomonas formosensis]|uniref:putative bifunctional diguanylate cyclase/phosphodiesterase n=1 Tax=Flavisphingomonas formosensis TaxID=861534 RepID=UPI0012FB8D6A|nr:bifunctional diguanylate cyclase/phosphodiesterase [Sphingomonas formosensis]
MRQTTDLPVRPSARFPARVVLPIALAVLGIAGTLSLDIFWSARSSDAIALNRQIRMVRHAIDASIDQLSQNQEAVAVWDPLFAEMERGAPDVRWIDDNVGGWLHNSFGHDRVYLIDRGGRGLYALLDGRHMAPEAAWRSAGNAAREAVAELYAPVPKPGHLHDRVADRARTTLLPSGIRMPPNAIHVSHLALVDGQPAAISAMKIVPNSAELRARNGEAAGTIVSIRFLGKSFLDELSRRNLLAGVRFTPNLSDVRPDERALSLIGEDGTSIGSIVWKPELPGAFVLEQAAPVAVAALLMMIVLMVWLIRSLSRSTHKLESAMAELRTSEAQAQHLAFHDPLTGLANRAMLHAKIDQTLHHGIGDGGAALILIDLDRFKRVNDTLGHAAGDMLLSQFAARIAQLCTRGEIAARLGGDEFAILMPRGADHVALRSLCQQVLAAARAPFDVSHSLIHIGASIGVACADGISIDRIELMRRADIALFRTKGHGKNNYCFFEGAMDELVLSRASIEDELHQAIRTGIGLTLHFQPLVAAKSSAITGLEALVRWNHPEHGLIGPDRFIPIAEESGLIVPLGEWVLREVCAMTRRWPGVGFAVNLSPVQFLDSSFASRLLAIVEETGADPSRIELEITEGVLLADDEVAGATLAELRRLGFHIALDDFGTGYSSLGYLQRFRVDRIKIDRSFVRTIGQPEDASAIIVAIITLGHAMNLRVTAEGVETDMQHRFLVAAGCDTLQGYHYSRAVPEAELVDLFRDGPITQVA